MTIKEIINVLQEKGINVKYRFRSDGGILITSINSQTFKGAEGNALARGMVGATLSEARKIQLEKIKPIKEKKRIKLYQPSDDIKKELRKVQRIWRKNKVASQGKPTLRKLRYIIQHEGIGKAKESLRQLYRYAQGLAYDENINHLIDYISFTATKLGNPESLNRLIELIEANREIIKEDYIKAVYDEFYKLNTGASPQEVVANIRAILNI